MGETTNGRRISTFLRLLCLAGWAGTFGAACSDEVDDEGKAPGETCVLTAAGAAACESNNCGQVVCTDGSQPTVCTGSSCASEGCPAGQTCVTFQDSSSWCVPDSVCQ